MKNSKGQALIEFVLVLPIILLIILSIIDLGNIISKKYTMENDIDVIIDMYNDENMSEINKYIGDKDIKLNYKIDNNLITFTLIKNIKISSPVIILLVGKNYEVNVTRSIYDK